MIYPKIIYKTRDNYKKVNNEDEHEKFASQGYKDNWLDDKPHDFKAKKEKALKKKKEDEKSAREEIKELYENVLKEEKEAEEAEENLKKAKSKAKKETKEAKKAKKKLEEKLDGNRKDDTEGSIKGS